MEANGLAVNSDDHVIIVKQLRQTILDTVSIKY